MSLIDTEEYQKLILNLMHSEEINKMIDATIYKDDERAKAAIRYGMAIASLYTCKCKSYVMPKDVKDLYEKLEERDKLIDAVMIAYNEVTKQN